MANTFHIFPPLLTFCCSHDTKLSPQILIFNVTITSLLIQEGDCDEYF